MVQRGWQQNEHAQNPVKQYQAGAISLPGFKTAKWLYIWLSKRPRQGITISRQKSGQTEKSGSSGWVARNAGDTARGQNLGPNRCAYLGTQAYQIISGNTGRTVERNGAGRWSEFWWKRPWVYGVETGILKEQVLTSLEWTGMKRLHHAPEDGLPNGGAVKQLQSLPKTPVIEFAVMLRGMLGIRQNHQCRNLSIWGKGSRRLICSEYADSVVRTRIKTMDTLVDSLI